MQTIKLIPVNNTAEQELTNILSRNRMFSTVDQFISMYNNDILSANNPTVKELVKLVENTYKNVSLSGRKIVIESPTEVAVENIIKLMSDWRIIVKLKRIATNLYDEEYDLNTRIVFNEEKTGIPLIEIYDHSIEDYKLVQHWSTGKIIDKTASLANNVFAAHLLDTYNNDETACYFKLEDLIDLDDSFVLDIEETLLNKAFIDNPLNEE